MTVIEQAEEVAMRASRDRREVGYHLGLSLLYLIPFLMHLVRGWDAWNGRRNWRGLRGNS